MVSSIVINRVRTVLLLGWDFLSVDEVVLLHCRVSVAIGLSRLSPHLTGATCHFEYFLLLSGKSCLVGVSLVHHSKPHWARYENVIICVVGRIHLSLHVWVILTLYRLEVSTLTAFVCIVIGHISSILTLSRWILLIMAVKLLNVKTVSSLMIA